MRSVSAIFLFDCRPGCSNGAGAGKNVPDHSPDSENRHRIYVIIMQCLQTESRWNMDAASMSGDRFRVKNAAEIISPNRRLSNALNKQPSTLHFSIRRRLPCSLRLRRLHPPAEIVGKSRKRPLQRLAALADRFTLLRQRLRDRAGRDRG